VNKMVARFFIFILFIAIIGYLLFRFIVPLIAGKAKFRKGVYDKYVNDEEDIADTKLAYINKNNSRVEKEVDKFLKKKVKKKNGV